MFPTVLGCYDEDLWGKVQKRAKFDDLESSSNTLSLLSAIEQEGYGIQSAKYALVTYHQVQVKLYCLSQGQDCRGYTVDHLESYSNMVDLT